MIFEWPLFRPYSRSSRVSRHILALISRRWCWVSVRRRRPSCPHVQIPSCRSVGLRPLRIRWRSSPNSSSSQLTTPRPRRQAVADPVPIAADLPNHGQCLSLPTRYLYRKHSTPTQDVPQRCNWHRGLRRAYQREIVPILCCNFRRRRAGDFARPIRRPRERRQRGHRRRRGSRGAAINSVIDPNNGLIAAVLNLRTVIAQALARRRPPWRRSLR